MKKSCRLPTTEARKSKRLSLRRRGFTEKRNAAETGSPPQGDSPVSPSVTPLPPPATPLPPHLTHPEEQHLPAILEPTPPIGSTSGYGDLSDEALEAIWSQVSLESSLSEPEAPQPSTMCRKQSVVKKQMTLFSFVSVQSQDRSSGVVGSLSGTGVRGQRSRGQRSRGQRSREQRSRKQRGQRSREQRGQRSREQRGERSREQRGQRSRAQRSRGQESTMTATASSTGTSTVSEELVPEIVVEGQKRACPFYKKIPGTAFTVDAFKYGSIAGCSAYFLSHFHADHYVGLKRSFQHSLYCSQVTGNLVQQQLKVSGNCVHTLPLDQPVVIDKVEVTFLEANHCPGSVLILFRLKNGQNFLHTGDFRYSPSMLHHPSLVGLTIHQLYLDTTYCDPRYDFPAQEEVVRFAVEKCLSILHQFPHTLIVCGTYTIGKEKVFRAIANVLGVRICVSREKKAVLDCLDCPALSEALTTDYSQSCLHVLPMAKLNLRALSSHFESWSGAYSHLLAFKPTGWTYSGGLRDLSSLQPQVKGPVTIYGIPYSEHSSYVELRRCVQGLRPLRVIPTVNNFSPQQRDEMQRTFRQWLLERDGRSLVQSKLSLSPVKLV